MKKIILSAFAFSFLLIACSKDQKVVNSLEGNWKVSKSMVNGVALADSLFSGTTYSFEKCKVKKEDCSGTLSEDGKSVPFTYKISEKGEKFTMKFTILTETVETVADIKESDGKVFTYSYTEDGDTFEQTLSKN